MWIVTLYYRIFVVLTFFFNLSNFDNLIGKIPSPSLFNKMEPLVFQLSMTFFFTSEDTLR